MIMSPATWRALLKPRFSALIAELKALNPALKIAYHTDGYVEPVIGDLIEIGVDVLHPVQPASMDPAALKKKFGDRLCFMGTIDVQSTLPFGSPADVRREVEERLRTVGQGGGLILAPTHHVQLDTPIENLMAMLEAAKAHS
jgi:uroporphyrinogen-III decarboxylase